MTIPDRLTIFDDAPLAEKGGAEHTLGTIQRGLLIPVFSSALETVRRVF